MWSLSHSLEAFHGLRPNAAAVPAAQGRACWKINKSPPGARRKPAAPDRPPFDRSFNAKIPFLSRGDRGAEIAGILGSIAV